MGLTSNLSGRNFLNFFLRRRNAFAHAVAFWGEPVGLAQLDSTKTSPAESTPTKAPSFWISLLGRFCLICCLSCCGFRCLVSHLPSLPFLPFHYCHSTIQCFLVTYAWHYALRCQLLSLLCLCPSPQSAPPRKDSNRMLYRVWISTIEALIAVVFPILRVYTINDNKAWRSK